MTERADSQAEVVPAAPEPLNPAAVSIALDRRASAGTTAVDLEAAAFLRDQRRLINLQAEHLHEQRALHLAHLRVRRWKDRMSLSLQSLAAIAGAVVAIGFAVMAWSAHQDHGLVTDAFSVPSDLSSQGLSGSVVAQRFLDKLNALQLATESDRPAETFQNNWGEDIKVEIPETGLKLGELKKFLRDQLGKVSHVTGEVYKTTAGIAVTGRLGDTPPQTLLEGSRSQSPQAHVGDDAGLFRTEPAHFCGLSLELGRRPQNLRHAMVARCPDPRISGPGAAVLRLGGD